MRPCSLRFLLVLLLFIALAAYFYLKYRPPYAFYAALATAELAHAGQFTHQPKYVYFKQIQGAGFTNQAQEILLFHHLALATSRTYVFQPFIWNHRHASLPLSAFLLGPTKDSLSYALFDSVCPEVKHVNIFAQPNDLWNEATNVLSSDDRCIAVDNWIFSWSFLSTDGIQAIWPSYQKYLSAHFEWPAHIQDMVARAYSTLNLRPTRHSTEGLPYLAIHFRRGDFEEHCKALSETHTGFTTWANLPLLHQAVVPPALHVNNQTSIVEHCYPSLRRILDAIDFHLRSRPHIRAAYFLHDGAWDHLNVYMQYYKLEYALKSPQHARNANRSEALQLITHSGMLPVSWGERDWKVAVDLEIARNADVFIGNGYSSLSAQIIALRLADGGTVDDIGLL